MSYLISFGGGSSGGLSSLTGNSGGAVGPTTGNINIVGSGGVTVAGNPGTSTLTVTVSGSGMTWNEVTTASQSMAVNNAYVANNTVLVTLTLPAVAAFGDIVQVVGKGTGLWTIAQNAGQTIHFGTLSTTTGVGGSISSISQRDTLEIVCTTANTDWTVYTAVGNLTVV